MQCRSAVSGDEHSDKRREIPESEKTIWMLQTKRADFEGLAAKLHVSPVLVRIMRNRGLETEDEMRSFLYGRVEELGDARKMKDMSKTAEILLEKLKADQRIRIIGDYDIDGVCSTYILLTGIGRAAEQIGSASQIDYEIPDRIRDGYGINESIIRTAGEDKIDTLITCDNGIAAYDEVALAKEMGMTVLVTDHHEVPQKDGRDHLPPADAVVNPHREDDEYPFPELCGGVVAYRLMEVLYDMTGVPKDEWREMLPFAAVATVGDVMRLQGENRLIVRDGLKMMKDLKNPGLRKLAEKTGVDLKTITAYHIGFVIGPCINAGGRLETAKLALELLRSRDEQRADELAEELKNLNDLRKDMTREGEEKAIRIVEENYPEDKVLVVFLPECHESLAGIIAGRLREHFHRPSFVLTRGEELVKGSGRSIPQYSMYESLCRVGDLLTKFGGHPMAAGLSMEEAKIDEFRRRLNEDSGLVEDDLIPRIWIDVPVPLDYLSEKLVQELKTLEPYGQGNEKPQFAQKGLLIRTARVLGRNRNVVRLGLTTESGMSMDGILFGDGDAFMKELSGRKRIDIVYYPDINEYNGNRTLQVVIKNYKIN